MLFYWSAKAVPELADLPRVERRRILVATGQKPFRLWQYWGALLGGFVFLLLLNLFALPALAERGSSKGLRVLIMFAVVGLVIVLLRHVGFHFTRPFIREYLQSKGSTEGEVDA